MYSHTHWRFSPSMSYWAILEILTEFEAMQVKIYMLGMLEDLQCNGSDSREQSYDKASMSGWACKYN